MKMVKTIIVLTEQDVKELVKEAFVELGLNTDIPLEAQRDMAFLRDLRMSSQSMRNRSFLTIVSIVITGIAAAIWLGLQQLLKVHP